jgi:hypothetical protein
MTTQAKKILIYVIVPVLFLLIVSGMMIHNHINSQANLRHIEADKIELTDSEVMSNATHIVDAVYIGEQITKYGSELIFEPVAVIKGDIGGEDLNLIYVQPLETHSSASMFNTDNSVPYIKGEEYMLFLEKNISVYYEHNKYVQIGEMIISAEDDQWDEYHTKASDVIAQTENIAPSSYGVKYSDSTEVKELIDFSSNIFVVKVTNIYAESTLAPTTVYNCTVTKVVRGVPAESGNILITFFNDTVKTSEEYLVLLADASETAPVYTLSSQKNCVYSVDDVKLTSDLELLLKQATDFRATELNRSDQDILDEEKAARDSN